jgi:hypothetical protein
VVQYIIYYLFISQQCIRIHSLLFTTSG